MDCYHLQGGQRRIAKSGFLGTDCHAPLPTLSNLSV